MSEITITKTSIEKIGSIFEKQCGKSFFYAMRQHKHVWPKLVKCTYKKDYKGKDTVIMRAFYSWAYLRGVGKTIEVTLYANKPVMNGMSCIKYKLRKPQDAEQLCHDLNGLALTLKTLSNATASVIDAADKMKVLLDINLPNK